MYRAVPPLPAAAAEVLYPTRRPAGGRLALATAVALAMTAALGCSRRNPAFWDRQAPPDALTSNGLVGDAEPMERKPAPDAGPPEAQIPADASPDLGIASIGVPDTGPALPPLGPRDITITGETDARQYGSYLGLPHTETCPEDQVLIGYRGADQGTDYGDLLTGLEAVCGQLTIRSDDNSPYVAIEPGITLGVWGSDEPEWTAVCPDHEVVIGFGGRAGESIDQLEVHCAHIDISAARTLHIGKPTALPAHGGTAGVPILDAHCPPGTVARGHHLRSGFWIDRLGLICGTPMLRQ